MQTAQKLHNSAETHQTLKQNHPLEFNQANPNAYQMIALCLCNNMTLSWRKPPSKKISWLITISGYSMTSSMASDADIEETYILLLYEP